MTRVKVAKERGSALIAALGLSLVLAIVAIALSQSIVQTSHQQRTALDRFTEEADLNSAVAAALLHMAQTETPIAAGTRMHSHGLEVEYWSPLGRVDLNTAQPLMLTGAIRAAGLDEPEARAAAIIDWRDPDDLLTLHGAESRAYSRWGLQPPSNRPFRTVSELARVIGFSEADTACLRPFVTLATGEEAPRADLAPVTLQRALGLAINEGAFLLPDPNALIGLSIQHRDEARLTHTILVRITGDPQTPYLIQDWRRADINFDCAGVRP